MWVEHNKNTKDCYFLRMNHNILQINENKVSKKEVEAKSESNDSVADAHASTPDDYERCCKICMEGLANIALTPCGHVAVCGKCMFGLKDKCPICREKVAEKMLIKYIN